MSFRIYDYVCTNKKCSEFEVVKEHMVRADQVDSQTCEVCEKPVHRKVSGIKSAHVSWSTWRI